VTDVPAVSVIIAARNEQHSIAAAVRAARALGAAQVIVADDGSSDDTARLAEEAGALVSRLPRRRGKGAALRQAISQAKGGIVLLLDGDLGASAAESRHLLRPVMAGAADMAVAIFPPTQARAGFGIARGLAFLAIALMGWRRMKAPLSGQRAIARSLLDRLHIANRFGVEVALTLDALALGAKIAEVQTAMIHRPTGRNLAGFVHRGKQALDVLSVVIPRLIWPVGPTGNLAGRSRTIAWLVAWAATLSISWAIGPLAFMWATYVFWCFLVLLLSLAAINRFGLKRRNYAQRALPTGLGLIFPTAAALSWIVLRTHELPPLIAACALGAAGLLDDIVRSPERGLGGHLRALARGRVTSGAIKAIAGGGACITIGLWVNAWHPWPGLADGLLIALCANALNLLDLAPGRALKVFFAGAAMCAFVSPGVLWWLGPVMLAAAVYAPLDLFEQAMMGDAGSNALGALLGLAIVQSLPVWGRLAALGLLVALHIYCERRSLSATINRFALLRWLDNLLRPYAS
jgi:glycosyltransferase involved in cell wall biosynthesis